MSIYQTFDTVYITLFQVRTVNFFSTHLESDPAGDCLVPYLRPMFAARCIIKQIYYNAIIIVCNELQTNRFRNTQNKLECSVVQRAKYLGGKIEKLN